MDDFWVSYQLPNQTVIKILNKKCETTKKWFEHVQDEIWKGKTIKVKAFIEKVRQREIITKGAYIIYKNVFYKIRLFPMQTQNSLPYIIQNINFV